MTPPSRANAASPTEANSRSQRKFRPEIQGLRAVALALVVAYHVWLGRVSGGVDVFLLISAFLMTGQFVDRYRRGTRVSLPRHWVHTFRRLLPAAVVTIVGTVVASLAILPGTRWATIVEQAWASLFYAENWVLQRDAVNYYAQDHSTASPFQHFWSLSIQGQVFLVFPVVFLVVAALCRRARLNYERVLFWAFAALFLVSLVYSVYETAVSQSEAYFDTAARVWEFALGALLAIVSGRVRLPARAAAAAGWAGLALIIACGLVLQVDGVFPGFAALWPTLAAGAVILAGEDGGRRGVHRLLGLAPFQRLGNVSYSLYLWHWPVLVLVTAVRGGERPGWLAGSAVIVASLTLAYVTTRFVDKPWRAWRWPEVRVRQGLAAVVACVAAVALPVGSIQASIQIANHKAIANAPRNNPGAAALVPGYNGTPDPKASLLPLPSKLEQDWASLPQQCDQDLGLSVKLRDNGCTQVGQPGASKTVLVVGNSHAQQWLGALLPMAEQHGWRMYQLLKGGCVYQPPSSDVGDDCNEFNQEVSAQIAAHRPDAVVLVGTAAAPSSAEETLTPGLEQLVDGFTKDGIDVVALRDNPRFAFNMSECVVQHGEADPACRAPSSSLLAPENPLTGLASRYRDRFHAIDLTDFLCPGGECRGVIGNVFVYLDSNHLSRTYTSSLAPILEQRIIAATGWA
ncbi:acyltransferase family protein [Sinomonas sp.]|uniref:acyltransferase family protein n=1 Tax=Sinomonas sp. TaxID=1914986 RepID=UPI003F822589